MDLSRITLLTEYEIVGIDLEEASVRHLADLGIRQFYSSHFKNKRHSYSLSSSCEDCLG